MPKKTRTPAAPWRNRIVGQRDVAPQDLEPSPFNWRQHPTHQRDALSGALRELGWIQQIVVNQSSGKLIDGHLRLALALEHQAPTVPVLYVDLSEDEERLALVTLDPLAALAETNQAALAAVLQQVQSGEAAVQAMLSRLAEQQGLVPPDDPEALWQGMPAFHQEDKLGIQQIIVHFDTREDVAAFAQLVEQPITEQTKSLWYPPHTRGPDAFFVADNDA